jgi:ABC-type glycerol-3-phosphate transport system permease component
VVIALGSTLIALVFAVPAAYGFARFRFRGRRFGQACILAGQMLPTAAIIVPLFIVMRVLGLLNTYAGLIVVYLILTLPLSVWMLIGYFRAIPFDIEEAAIVDGASRLGVLVRITFPPVPAGRRGGTDLFVHHGLERVHLRPVLRAGQPGQDAAHRLG